jgi:hypothetical protein
VFRVTVKTCVVVGSIHYHCRLLSRRPGGDRVVGILVLYADEWTEFLRVCEALHIEVTNEVPPQASAHPAS